MVNESLISPLQTSSGNASTTAVTSEQPVGPSLQDLALKTHGDCLMEKWTDTMLRDWLEAVLSAAIITSSPSSQTKNVIDAIFACSQQQQSANGNGSSQEANSRSLQPLQRGSSSSSSSIAVKRKRDQLQDLSSSSMLFGTTTAAGRQKVSLQQSQAQKTQQATNTPTASTSTAPAGASVVSAFKRLNMKTVIERLRGHGNVEGSDITGDDAELVALVDAVRNARNRRLTHEQQQQLLNPAASFLTNGSALKPTPTTTIAAKLIKQEEVEVVESAAVEDDLHELLGEVLHTKSQFQTTSSNAPANLATHPSTSSLTGVETKSSAAATDRSAVVKPKIVVKIV
jgi:hypothetical protein